MHILNDFQVAQFGCTCFALLFDDIEPEMSEADKQIYQSFAHAQVITFYTITILINIIQINIIRYIIIMLGMKPF